MNIHLEMEYWKSTWISKLVQLRWNTMGYTHEKQRKQKQRIMETLGTQPFFLSQYQPKQMKQPTLLLFLFSLFLSTHKVDQIKIPKLSLPLFSVSLTHFLSCFLNSSQSANPWHVCCEAIYSQLWSGVEMTSIGDKETWDEAWITGW